MAVRVAGELAPCERVGECGSDTSNTGTDPTPLTSGYPRVQGAGAAGRAMPATDVGAGWRWINPLSPRGESLWWCVCVWGGRMRKHPRASHTRMEATAGQCPPVAPLWMRSGPPRKGLFQV